LNRGKYVLAALITSQKFAVRQALSNCVPLKAGQFGLTQDSVVQGESAEAGRGEQLSVGAERHAPDPAGMTAQRASCSPREDQGLGTSRQQTRAGNYRIIAWS
jgi:hypothetical protein